MGSRIMKGMGIREPLAALQELPVSPESPRHSSTSQPFSLLMATGAHSCLLFPTVPAPHSGPIKNRRRRACKVFQDTHNTLQGYFPSYRVVLICLAIEEFLASMREFIFWGALTDILLREKCFTVDILYQCI